MGRLLRRYLPMIASVLGVSNSEEYRKKHSTKVRFSKYYHYHDRDKDRRLQPFHVHGEVVMAYSKKDAIKRWVHADLKHRRK